MASPTFESSHAAARLGAWGQRSIEASFAALLPIFRMLSGMFGSSASVAPHLDLYDRVSTAMNDGRARAW